MKSGFAWPTIQALLRMYCASLRVKKRSLLLRYDASPKEPWTNDSRHIDMVVAQ